MKSSSKVAVKLAMAIGCSLVALSNIAHAEHLDQAAVPSDEDVPARAEDEIIVTGQKRDESLQRTPVSVSVIGSEEIAAAGINGVKDLSFLTPNLIINSYLSSGNQTISFRGFTNVNSGKPPFAYVVDGVQQPSQEFLLQQLFDIEQIEVLRGPQGVLYGAGAIAGAINVVTKKPTNDYEASARFTAFEGQEFGGMGSVSGPIVEDKLLFRLSGYYTSYRGLIKNTTTNLYVDSYTDFGVQGRLLYTPTPDLSFDTRLRYFDDYSAGQWLIRSTLANIDTYDEKPVNDFIGYGDRHAINASNTIRYDLGSVVLMSITGYEDGKNTYYTDGDFTPNPVTAQKQYKSLQTFNQEIRFSSGGSNRFNWMVSGFYQNERMVATSYYTPIVNNKYTFNNPSSNNLFRGRTWAIAAQIDYEIVDALTLILGGRYDNDRRRALDYAVTTGEDKNTFSEFQPKASLTYQATDTLFLYANYSKGFRTGGFNTNSPIGAREYGNETSQTYEVGEKWRSPNGIFTVNGALYYTDYKDQQFIYGVILPQGVFNSIANIPRSRSYGGEVEVNVKAAEGLVLRSSFGYSPSQVREFPVTGYPANAWVDKYIPRVYKYTLNGGFQYDRPIVDDISLMLRVDASNWSAVYQNIVNNIRMGPKIFVNGRIQISGGEQWSVALVGRNIFSEITNGAVGGNPFVAAALTSRNYTQPRQIGIEINLKM